MEGIGRSWSLVNRIPVLNVKMRSTIKRLKRSRERGSPWQRPTFDVNGCPSVDPTLIWAVVWA